MGQYVDIYLSVMDYILSNKNTFPQNIFFSGLQDLKVFLLVKYQLVTLVIINEAQIKFLVRLSSHLIGLWYSGMGIRWGFFQRHIGQHSYSPC